MNVLASLLLITALTFPTSFLVLRSGQRIDVDGSVAIDNGRVTFRSGGALYSIDERDVDLDATRSMTVTAPAIRAEVPNKLKVTPEERARLLHDLEQNHSGVPVAEIPKPVASKSATALAQDSQEEWNWKQRAQAYEENIRRAREEVDMLRSRVDQLQNRVRSLLSMGYKPGQFTYDSSQLQYAQDSLPGAELELTRAERAYEQFLDNARRQGVLPGWLR